MVNVGAVAIVLVLGAVATAGIRLSSRVTNVLVAVKVAICVFVVLAGLFFVKAANLSPFVPPSRPPVSGDTGLARPLSQLLFGSQPSTFGMAGVLTAAAVVFFAYTGFEAVANLGEKTRRPSRDLPLGLFGTLGVSALLYVAVSYVVVGMVDYRRIDPGAPIASAFRAAGAPWAAPLPHLAGHRPDRLHDVRPPPQPPRAQPRAAAASQPAGASRTPSAPTVTTCPMPLLRPCQQLIAGARKGPQRAADDEDWHEATRTLVQGANRFVHAVSRPCPGERSLLRQESAPGPRGAGSPAPLEAIRSSLTRARRYARFPHQAHPQLGATASAATRGGGCPRTDPGKGRTAIRKC